MIALYPHCVCYQPHGSEWSHFLKNQVHILARGERQKKKKDPLEALSKNGIMSETLGKKWFLKTGCNAAL